VINEVLYGILTEVELELGRALLVLVLLLRTALLDEGTTWLVGTAADMAAAEDEVADGLA